MNPPPAQSNMPISSPYLPDSSTSSPSPQVSHQATRRMHQPLPASWPDDQPQCSTLHVWPPPLSTRRTGQHGKQRTTQLFYLLVQPNNIVEEVVITDGRITDCPLLSIIPPLRDLPIVDPSFHWGHRPVYWAGTSQVHHKEMDKVPSMYPPSTSWVHPEFSLPISLQFPWPGEWSVHSQCPRSCDCNVPIR